MLLSILTDNKVKIEKKNSSSTLSSLKPTFQKYFFKLKLFSAAVKSS